MTKKILKTLTTALVVATPVATVFACGSSYTKDAKAWGGDEFLKDYDNLTYQDEASEVTLINEINYDENSSDSIYQMLVYSFADGNEDGIGDFWGLANKMDYLSELGIGAIWLSPIHPASSYHGYDIIDYTAVAPEFGGMEAFDAMLKKAHEHNIEIQLDMVFNHTSYEHPWFQEALKGNPKYRDYYFFDNDKEGNDKWHSDDDWKRDHFLNLNIDKNRLTTDDWYYGDFWGGMPDLNFDNEDVIEELEYIQEFWTKKGVDGYRYDAFYHFTDGDPESKNEQKINETFARLRKASEKGAAAVNRDSSFDTYMYGEWWGTPQDGEKYFYYNDGAEDLRALDAVYDVQSYGAHASTPVPMAKVDEFDEITNTLWDHNTGANWLTTLNHHDINRWLDNYRKGILGMTAEEIQSAKGPSQKEIDAIATQLFIMMASPSRNIIYYGDELAYVGFKNPSDSSMREPMNWSDPESRVSFFEARSGEGETIAMTASKYNASADKAATDSKSAYASVKAMNKIIAENDWLKGTQDNSWIEKSDFETYFGEFNNYSIIRINPNDPTDVIAFITTPERELEVSFKHNFEVLYKSHDVTETDEGVSLKANQRVAVKLNA